MANSVQQTSFFRGTFKEISSFSLFLSLAVASLICIGGAGIWIVEQQMKENLKTQLQIVLSGNLESLRIWTEDTKLDARVLANQPGIKSDLVSLLNVSQRKTSPLDASHPSTELTQLRKNLGEACKTYGFTGFVVFDPTGLQVGALLDEPIGKRQLMKKSDFFQRSLQGNTLISQPFPAEIDLPDKTGAFQSNMPTMFVSTPIQDEPGNVVGVLAFRLKPEKDFSHILSVSQFGESGETYAFNGKGVMVSKSRFDKSLLKAGLLKPGQSSIFNIRMQNPGRNLSIQKLNPDEDTSKWPFTEMFLQALQKQTGVQVDGYNDYRGVPVIGAWNWVPELDIGLATEVDVAEAFRPLKTQMTWFLFLFALLMFFGVVAFVMRSRYAQSQQQTIENEQQLSSFLDGAFDPIICIDSHGTIQRLNPAVHKHFGYQPDELLGKNVKILMADPYHNEHDGYLKAYLKTGKTKIINTVTEVTARKKNGTLFPLELSVSESVVRGEKIFLGIIRDISERKEAEKELKHAYTELEKRIHERTEELWQSKNLAEKSNQAKSEFLSRMSHELRTPMNAILGFAQLMQESTRDPLPQAQRKRNGQILKAGNHLLDLINEVLDLASIEAGKITVSLEPVCIAELAEEVLTVVRPLSKNFNINLVDQITDNKELYILADKTRLKQVLLNLLSNGIKYNRREGSVTLSASLEDSFMLRIDVTDTGMGIPEEKMNQLFDPFNRLGAEDGEIEGTGIGMTISKKLMEVMGGSIDVKSSLGEGSTFCVRLPIVCQDPPAMNVTKDTRFSADHYPKNNEADEESFTLLYIEDNQANLKLVEDILTDYPEIKLLSATYAKAGLNMAMTLKPNLILMDINLPDFDGIEALKRLRNFEETHKTPVIAISANALKKDIERAKTAGFSTYITKPIDIDQFRITIESELKIFRSSAEDGLKPTVLL